MTRSRVDPATSKALAPERASELMRGLPGSRLRPLLTRFMSETSISLVVDPILADLHAEWLSHATRSASTSSGSTSSDSTSFDSSNDSGGAALPPWHRIRLRTRLVLELSGACGQILLLAALRYSARRILTGSCAAGITLGLLFMMQSLISPSGAVPPSPRAPQSVTRAILPVPKKTPPPPPTEKRDKEIVELPETTLSTGFDNKDRRPPRFPIEGIVVPGTPGGTGTNLGGEGIELVLTPSESCMPLSRMQPIYPERAKSRNIEGRVRVRVDIDASGQVTRTTIIESAHPILSRAVETAARRWRYQPSSFGGNPERSTGDGANGCSSDEVLLTFELPD